MTFKIVRVQNSATEKNQCILSVWSESKPKEDEADTQRIHITEK